MAAQPKARGLDSIEGSDPEAAPPGADTADEVGAAQRWPARRIN